VDLEESEPTATLSRVVVMDQRLPGTLGVRRITMEPGFAAGLHVHNGPVFGSVETGSVVYQIDGVDAGLVFPES
jgi:hypothetical protein